MKTTEAQHNPSPDIKKLAELIKDIKICMMTTVDPDNALRSRPMASQEMEFDGDLWFFTSKASGKVHSITNDQQVNLAYASAKSYISITGRAELIEDRAKAQELWNPMYKAWFPEGLEDPDLILMRVRVDSAEYWDSASSSVVHVIGAAKAAMTGKPFAGELGEHKKVDLHH